AGAGGDAAGREDADAAAAVGGERAGERGHLAVQRVVGEGPSARAQGGAAGGQGAAPVEPLVQQGTAVGTHRPSAVRQLVQDRPQRARCAEGGGGNRVVGEGHAEDVLEGVHQHDRGDRVESDGGQGQVLGHFGFVLQRGQLGTQDLFQCLVRDHSATPFHSVTPTANRRAARGAAHY